MTDEVKLHLKQVVKYLCENHHPHTSITIECDGRQLREGLEREKVIEFIRD